MITLDTSALLSLVRGRDPDHHRVLAALERVSGARLIPIAILSEFAYLLESRNQTLGLTSVLADVQHGAYELDCGDENMPRIRDLIDGYSDLPLGFADAAVIACAERNGGLVLSLDRDFWVVGREGKIRILPD